MSRDEALHDALELVVARLESVELTAKRVELGFGRILLAVGASVTARGEKQKTYTGSMECH